MDSVAAMAQREQNRLPAVRNVKITALDRSIVQRQDLMSFKTVSPKKGWCVPVVFFLTGVGGGGTLWPGTCTIVDTFFFLEQVLCVMPRVLMSTRYELNETMSGTIPGTEFLAKDENSNLIGYAPLMG